jgi:hypothetical protein
MQKKYLCCVGFVINGKDMLNILGCSALNGKHSLKCREMRSQIILS